MAPGKKSTEKRVQYVQKQERGEGDVPREEEGNMHEAERAFALDELPLGIPGVHEMGPASTCDEIPPNSARGTSRDGETTAHTHAPIEPNQDHCKLVVQKENVGDHVRVFPVDHLGVVPMSGLRWSRCLDGERRPARDPVA